MDLSLSGTVRDVAGGERIEKVEANESLAEKRNKKKGERKQGAYYRDSQIGDWTRIARR